MFPFVQEFGNAIAYISLTAIAILFKKVKAYPLIFFFFVNSYLLLKMLQDPSDVAFDVNSELWFTFVLYSFACVFLIVPEDDVEMVFHIAYYVAIFGLVVEVIMALSPFYPEKYNYMRVGYATLPSFLVFVFYSVHYSRRRFLNVALSLISLLVIFVFGNRGSLFGAFLGVLSYLLLFVRPKVMFILVTVLSFLGFLVVKMFILFAGFLGNLSLFYSYQMMKFAMLVQGGDLDRFTSGRLELYSAGEEYLFSSPFWGERLNLAFDTTGATYFHNVFLDNISTLGLLPFSLFALYFAVILIVSFSNADLYGKIYIWFLMHLGVDRLLFSSTIWQRPEFVLLVFTLTFWAFSRSKSPCKVNENYITGLKIDMK